MSFIIGVSIQPLTTSSNQLEAVVLNPRPEQVVNTTIISSRMITFFNELELYPR